MGSKARILAVDDDAMMREALRDTLTAEGYSVVTVETAMAGGGGAGAGGGGRGVGGPESAAGERARAARPHSAQLADDRGDRHHRPGLASPRPSTPSSAAPTTTSPSPSPPRRSSTWSPRPASAGASGTARSASRRSSRRRAASTSWSASRRRSSSIRQLIQTAAASEATVLVQGESGTGKEIIANADPRRTRERARGPLVKMNCAAVPETLLESELFGHEKGAFTGADRRRHRAVRAGRGRDALPRRGVRDAPAPAGEVPARAPGAGDRAARRLGGRSRSTCASSRPPTATSRQALKDGTLREDLYYRLNVILVRVPPLRERMDDVPMLAMHFLRKYAAREGLPMTEISAEALDAAARLRVAGERARARERDRAGGGARAGPDAAAAGPAAAGASARGGGSARRSPRI